MNFGFATNKEILTTVEKRGYHFVESEGDGEFKRYLQGILNEHHETAYPLMEVPESERFVIRVTDGNDRVVGGALAWAYWGWLDVSLVALEKRVRGHGLGRQLMAVIEEKARERGCTRARVETFEREVGFYQRMGYRIVGCLEDYPEGHNYYWMCRDL